MSDKFKKIKESSRADMRKAKKSRKIKSKIGALERAYMGGYIRRNTYEKIRERMKSLLWG